MKPGNCFQHTIQFLLAHIFTDIVP